MNVGTRSPALAALVLILMAAPGWARAEGDAAPAAPASSAASSSPVSATGLLPIFGVGLDMDALPPGASPEDAVASVQKLWDKYLKSAGFNVIQFPVEVKELGDQGAGRLAKLHASEQTALAGTSLQATPVLASASFDYELIRFGAIVNVPLTDESYQQAYESLRSYLSTILGSAAIDVVSLEWFPGSVSANAVDRFPDLVAKL